MAETNLPSTVQSNWQDSIDQQFQERLMRPLVQPGLTKTTQLAKVIISRSQRLGDRLPLLAELNQRLSSITTGQTDEIPIVYAQPLPSQDNTADNLTTSVGSSVSDVQLVYAQPLPSQNNTADNFNISKSSSVSEVQRKEVPVVQAKLATGNESNSIPKVRANLANDSGNNSQSNSWQSGTSQNLLIEKANYNQTHNSLSPAPNINKIPIAQTQLSSLPISQTYSDYRSISYSEAIHNNENNLENFGQNPSLYLSNVSANESSITQAKSDPTIQSHQLSFTSPNERVNNNKSKSLLPIVKVINDLSYGSEYQANPTLNQLTVNHVLATEILNSTTAATNPFTKTSKQLSINTNNSNIATPEKNRPHSQPLVTQKAITRWKGLDTPLLFSIPPLIGERAVAANGNQQYSAGVKLENPRASQVMNTENVSHPAATVSQSPAPNTRHPVIAAIQESSFHPATTDTQTQIDVDALADKIERKLMQRLVIENERRGQKRWR